jgi:molybdate transport system regulatory protein
MVRFLDCVSQSGSIRQAAMLTGVTYNHAWLLVKRIEHIVGKPVLKRVTGGSTGGGSKLSETGLSILSTCHRIEALSNEAVMKDLKHLFSLLGAPR